MLPSRVGLLGSYNLVVDIRTNQVNYNLRQVLGNPVGRRRIYIRIRPGVEITSANPTLPSFDTGDGWAPGTEFIFDTQGDILGAGGFGGNGGSTFLFVDGTPGSSIAAFPGRAGGTALRVTGPAVIRNGGNIWGGGGGGGGGQAGWWGSPNAMVAIGGTGGSGGAGSGGGSAGSKGFATLAEESIAQYFTDGFFGINGTRLGGGSSVQGARWDTGISFEGVPVFLFAGDGGAGGSWGQSGGSGGFAAPKDQEPFTTSSRPGDDIQAAGGAAGKAVDTGGFPITWEFGLTSAQVKGPVS